MLKLLGFMIKLALFSLIVLALGNWIEWDGKTISDQIKVQMSHPAKKGMIHDIQGWAEKLTSDAREVFQKKLANESTATEDITPSEREKLRSLIHDLNHSHH